MIFFKYGLDFGDVDFNSPGLRPNLKIGPDHFASGLEDFPMSP